MSFNQDFLQRQADPNELGAVVQQQGSTLQQVGQRFVRVENLDEIASGIGQLQFRAADATGQLRMIMSALNLLEELGVDGHFAGIDENGVVQFYVNASNGKFTIIGEEFPSITPVEWVAVDTGEVLGKVMSFYVAGVASGLYLLGQEKDASHYGVSGLAVQGDGQALGEYVTLLQIDSKDGGRARIDHVVSSVHRVAWLPAGGWQPYAFPIGVDQGQNFTADSFAMAVGELRVTPVVVSAPMLLQSVSVWNNNTSLQRSWAWKLYYQEFNTGSSSENTLTKIAVGATTDVFTPGAASLRTITADGAPTYIPPGVYWIGIRNEHGSNTFNLGGVLPATTFGIQNQSKVTAIADSVDFVAATWAKSQSLMGVRLNGRVFGQTSAF